MKKRIITLLIACLSLAMMITSCNQAVDKNETQLIPEKNTNTPQEKQAYSFDNYTDLVKWLKEETNSAKDSKDWGGDYIDYVKEVNTASSNDTPLYIPYIDGSLAELRKEEGFSGITFMTSELYNVPWVWYYVNIEGEEVVIKCACLTQKDFERVNVQKASVAVKNFSRSAPNIDNYESKSNYKAISERTIKLSGESISALYLEPNNDSRVSLQFVFDKTMVIITGSSDIINSDIINSISLQKADIN